MDRDVADRDGRPLRRAGSMVEDRLAGDGETGGGAGIVSQAVSERPRHRVTTASTPSGRTLPGFDLAGYLEHRQGSADLVRRYQERLAARAVLRLDEQQSFGRDVAEGDWSAGHVVVDIAHECWLERVGDVEHHDSADALETNEGSVRPNTLPRTRPSGSDPLSSLRVSNDAALSPFELKMPGTDAAVIPAKLSPLSKTSSPEGDQIENERPPNA